VVDVLGVLPRRWYDAFHQAAGDRPDGDHEREHSDVDGPPATLDRELRILAHAQDHIGGDLTLAEACDGALPRTEVLVDPGASLRRSDVREHGGVERLDVDTY
jgi:hypothetical protein